MWKATAMTTTTLETIDQPILAAPEFKTLLLADWRDVTFIHYAIDPALLQPHVPFELDLYAGQAWVSLVTCTQARLRPALGGRLTAWTMRPVATHPFLNLRTYVRAHGHRAIYFLAEWIPNPLSCLVGPRLYGLPFHLARLAYEHNHRLVNLWCGRPACLNVNLESTRIPSTTPGYSAGWNGSGRRPAC